MDTRNTRETRLRLSALALLLAIMIASPGAWAGVPGKVLRPERPIDCKTGFPPNNGGRDLAAELAAVMAQVPRAQAKCMRQTIACADDAVENRDFYAAVITSAQPRGTILSFSGTRGASFHTENVAEYVRARFRVVLIAYDMTEPGDAWECSVNGCPEYTSVSDPGPLDAACRPAAVISYFKNKFSTGAFCAQGHSAGSSQLAYAMSHYGLGETFDYVQFTAWTPLAKPACGCDPSNWPSTCPDPEHDGMRSYTTNPPPGNPGEVFERPFYYAVSPGPNGQNILTFLKDSFGLHAGDECRGLNAAPISQDAFTRLTSNGIVSLGADYDYGSTILDLYACGDPRSCADGNGSWYLEKIAAANPGQVFVETIPWVEEDQDCAFEDVWNDPDGGYSPLRQKTIDRMLEQCVDHGDAGTFVETGQQPRSLSSGR